LKLKYDVPLSNFAFKFNLRRYIKGSAVINVRGIAAIMATIPRGLLMIKKPENAGFLPVFEIDFVVETIELPGGAYVDDAHFNMEVFVDAAGAVSMRCDVNGTIGIGKSLPQALGDFGVSAYVEAAMRFDDTGVTLSEDIKVVLTAFYESKEFGFKLEGEARFLLPSPDRITFKMTCTLDEFAGEISGEVEATITVFINEDIAAARAILGDHHPTVRKLLAIDGDGDFYSSSGSAGARHALAVVPSAAGAGSGSSSGYGLGSGSGSSSSSGSAETTIIPYSNSTDADSDEASLGRNVGLAGPCGFTRMATIQYLDRQSIECRKSYGMYGFYITRSGCQNSENSWWARILGMNFRSVALCTTSSPAGVPVPLNASAPNYGCSEYSTGWKDISSYSGALVNIAAFAGEVECPRDHVMSGWRFRRANWRYAKIAFTCCKTTLPLGEIKAVYGKCDQGGMPSSRLEYLDRHSAKCPRGNVMTGWAIEKGCNSGYLRSKVGRCRLNL